MSLTRYAYANAIAGFFEFPSENARKILPAHLQPVELLHGCSIFSLTVFDFTDSEVGAYQEVVLAVIVAPLVEKDCPFPKAAYYPFQVATTTAAARQHAIERWHLPHWHEDVDIRQEQANGTCKATIHVDNEPVAELSVASHAWRDVSRPYQSFMADDNREYLARITMAGRESEHEDEKGRLSLYRHPFHKDLAVEEVYAIPFREIWMKDGLQTFEPLIDLRR